MGRVGCGVGHGGERLATGVGALCRQQRAVRDRQGVSVQAVSPQQVRRRGYSITRRGPDGLIVKRAADLATGDRLSVRLAAGEIRARVEVVAPEEMKESGSLF